MHQEFDRNIIKKINTCKHNHTLRNNSNPHQVSIKGFLCRFFTPKIEARAQNGRSESCSVVSDSLRSHRLYSPWNSPGHNTGVGSLSLLQGIFWTQGSNAESPTPQADSLPAEPQGKPNNTGVGSLSLLQRIFQTQEPNQGLLHCRWILYQLSYQGSPRKEISNVACKHISYTYCERGGEIRTVLHEQ